jgi:hypothetical protein
MVKTSQSLSETLENKRFNADLRSASNALCGLANEIMIASSNRFTKEIPNVY